MNITRGYRLLILLFISGYIIGGSGNGIEPNTILSTDTDTKYSNHLKQINKKVPPGFTIVIQPPFVVIGNESPDQVKMRAITTVQWAVDKLKQDYFTQDPDEIIDIWLFRDKESYDRYTREIFKDRPTTPFGYYSEQHQSLIMNVSTGGGTMVHEIVHPFMHKNFPKCPSWFNEGLASLYEQSRDYHGHILGMTNWRLDELQDSIRNRKLISFKKLCAMTDDEFYGRTDGTRYDHGYAQARYLCYYLQEKELLVKYYKLFTSQVETDHTGYKSLQQILNEPDMDVFKSKWENYVLKLKFP